MRRRPPYEDEILAVSLRHYLEALIRESKELTAATFVTYRTLLDSNEAKVALALDASNRAIEKQERATNERLHLLNELRSGVATIEQLNALVERVTDVKERLDKLEGRSAGAASLWGYLLGMVGLVASAVGIIVGTR